MSRRIAALSVVAGVVALGGAGAFALAYAGEPQSPTLAHSTARYAAPEGDRDGSLTFTTDITSTEGVKRVNVLAWPDTASFRDMHLTEKDMAAVETAECEPSGADTVHCTYRVGLTRADAEEAPRGVWHIAVLVTAGNGTTTLETEAADFTIG
ncbi:DUF5707 domain-containing protein [Streptomyces sp. NBC_00102]|uniref:DUF5707 domain-containing protein n=1 Tax=Streptomyces sp. NBC_00102 TaxID=2975652 RepID=UPI00225095D1|nr:DUF5707 domain-containing protein [Streptomyces sp. NBC_00102]MCX5397834.1 DUF5707 domain-containing protein [Streptomyces sp. NBC_00102]